MTADDAEAFYGPWSTDLERVADILSGITEIPADIDEDDAQLLADELDRAAGEISRVRSLLGGMT